MTDNKAESKPETPLTNSKFLEMLEMYFLRYYSDITLLLAVFRRVVEAQNLYYIKHSGEGGAYV